MKSSLTLFVSIFCFTGMTFAQDAEQAEEKDYIQLSDPVEETAEYRVFGSAFNSDLKTITLDKLVSDSKEFNKQEVSTEGTIKQVCQKKGCFFMLESGGKQARITFKDYSFFIPTNSAGARVKLNGVFNVHTISEEDAKHYAEDTGSNPDDISGPQQEYALTATSVVIYRW